MLLVCLFVCLFVVFVCLCLGLFDCRLDFLAGSMQLMKGLWLMAG